MPIGQLSRPDVRLAGPLHCPQFCALARTAPSREPSMCPFPERPFMALLPRIQQLAPHETRSSLYQAAHDCMTASPMGAARAQVKDVLRCQAGRGLCIAVSGSLPAPCPDVSWTGSRARWAGAARLYARARPRMGSTAARSSLQAGSAPGEALEVAGLHPLLLRRRSPRPVPIPLTFLSLLAPD